MKTKTLIFGIVLTALIITPLIIAAPEAVGPRGPRGGAFGGFQGPAGIDQAAAHEAFVGGPGGIGEDLKARAVVELQHFRQQINNRRRHIEN